MTRQEFNGRLRDRILVLDGATGTELHRRGLPEGVSPEAWGLDHPEVVAAIHRAYFSAGSDVVYACTFGANRRKLAEFGLDGRAAELNERLARLARAAAPPGGLVAGDIGPTGEFIEPFGELNFEEAVSIFREQVEGLCRGGVDLLVVETMMDIQEARAALLAAREACNLPVMVSMTFTEDGRTLNGTPPEAAAITLQSLGAAAIGCNCSMGPRGMLPLVRALKEVATVPVFAKPNAGLPKLVNGETVFDMPAGEFAKFAREFAAAGVNLLGGCCGTTPEFIAALRGELRDTVPVPPQQVAISAVSSPRRAVFFVPGHPVKVIGERINPTGKPKLQEELREGRFREVRRLAAEQEGQGADLLDVNVGMPGIDEAATLRAVVGLLAPVCETPLCIDSSDPVAVERALRLYPGRALLNSVSGERDRLRRVLPVAATYGAMLIALPLGDGDLPATCAERRRHLRKIQRRAEQLGCHQEDLLVDGLVMTVSADPAAARETLAMVRWAAGRGYGSVLGLSNVSFGLPERKWVNAAFLAMAAEAGVTAVIVNPGIPEMTALRHAADALAGRDAGCRRFIAFSQSGNAPNASAQSAAAGPATPESRMFQAVLAGDREHIVDLVRLATAAGTSATKLVDDTLIPAINEVGDRFDRKTYFLPQLMLSAETMKRAFDELEPALRDVRSPGRDKGTVVLATVQGDIHDIGKNIVALMLRNHGFAVVDLGKDVAAPAVVAALRDSGARLLGLSALMTTTLRRMPEIVAACRQAGLGHVKVMIGGAVVTEAYAIEIGADGYAPDAVGAVRLAERLLNPSGRHGAVGPDPEKTP
jgi:5-methyltetrahydrofolate--homocysteine methyltransferase